MGCIHGFQILFYMSPEMQVFSLYDPVQRGVAGSLPVSRAEALPAPGSAPARIQAFASPERCEKWVENVQKHNFFTWFP